MHAELLIMYALYCFRRQKQLPKVLNIYIDNYYLHRMNKRGFDCAISRFLFADSLLPLASFSLFLFSILPRLLTHFFLFSCTPSGLEPLTSRIALAYQSLFYTSTPRDSVENHSYPKVIFILLD